MQSVTSFGPSDNNVTGVEAIAATIIGLTL